MHNHTDFYSNGSQSAIHKLLCNLNHKRYGIFLIKPMLQKQKNKISYHFWLSSGQLRAGSKSYCMPCAVCQCQFQISADDFRERCAQFPGFLIRTSWSFQSCQSILPKKKQLTDFHKHIVKFSLKCKFHKYSL